MDEAMFQLTERVQPSDGWHYLVVAVSFSLIAISRFSQRNVIESMLYLLLKSRNIRSFARDTGAFDPVSGVLLTINFIITSTYLTYLFLFELNDKDPSYDLYNYLMLSGPVIYLFGTIIIMFFFGWIIGASEYFRSPITIEYSTLHVLGFLFSFILLAYAIEARILKELLIVSSLVFGALILWRILRSMNNAIRKGAPWYYIILYLCTLEILPLLVVIHSIR